MKNIKSFIFFFIYIISVNNLFCNNQQIDTINQDNNKFRLEIGAGAAISSMSFGYVTYDKLNLENTSNETFLSFNSELLNENKLFIEAYFLSNYALGLEIGHLIYFQSTNNDLSNGLTKERTNEYISGLYLSPYIVLSKFKIGGTFMLSSKNSWSLGSITHFFTSKRLHRT